MDTQPSTGTAGSSSPLAQAARAGLASARENALPGLFLWLLASAIVAGYWLVAPMKSAMDALGDIKQAGGFLYSAVSTAVFGGLIPFLWTLALGRRDTSRGFPWQAGLFLVLFWAWKGVEVDLLYRFQDFLFGSGPSWDRIVPKVAVDQFVYNPLWAGWTQALAYWWMEQHFRPSALSDRAFWGTLGRRVLTILISTWGIWIPMVSIIYSMPSNLQIPLFNIALCFWSLMLASLTREKKA